jgi:MFS family permease
VPSKASFLRGDGPVQNGPMGTTVEQEVAVGTDPAAVGRLQRRTLGILATTQAIGGAGIAVGIAVSALLAKQMAGTSFSGLAQSALVVGTAIFAIPTTRLMTRRGRRPGLGLAYLTGALGAVIVVVAASSRSVALLLVGLFLFGAGSTANLQARYAAVDLAEPAHRGRQLSFVFWATAIGSIAGPNLAPLMEDALHRRGFATNSGPFLASAAAFVIAALIVLITLRPDPLLTARTLAAAAPGTESAASGTADRTAADATDADRTDADGTDADGTAADGTAADGTAAKGLAAAAREVAASPGARLGLAAVAVGHMVMISVMTMTPVHIDEEGHPDTLRIIGLVLSVHIAGMYVLSPVVGWFTDRFGRRAAILGGIGLLLAACVVAGLSGHHTAGLTVGLGLLGMGWSATMVSGSTLLTESVGLANRASVQGLSDLLMGLGGAVAGALAGVVVAWSSYATLAMIAGVVTVPLLAAVLRPTAHSGRVA